MIAEGKGAPEEIAIWRKELKQYQEKTEAYYNQNKVKIP